MTDRAILILSASVAFLGVAIIFLGIRMKNMTTATDSLDAATSRLATSVEGMAKRFAAYAAAHPGSAEEAAAVEADVARLNAVGDALDAIGTDTPEAPAPEPVIEAVSEAAHPEDQPQG